MPCVELTHEECAVLYGVIDERLQDVRREIHLSDNPEFRMFLLRQEGLLAGLLERFDRPVSIVG